MSSLLDYGDRSTCVLFGDGAAAVVVTSAGSGLVVRSLQLGADGSLHRLVIIPGGGARSPVSAQVVAQGLHYFRMEGRELFRHAVRVAVASSLSCLESASLHVSELRWMVPHQANKRIMDAVAKGICLPLERVYSVLERCGNTSAAGMAIALHELMERHLLDPGDHVLLSAFGGGLTWGAALLTYEEEEYGSA